MPTEMAVVTEVAVLEHRVGGRYSIEATSPDYGEEQPQRGSGRELATD